MKIKKVVLGLMFLASVGFLSACSILGVDSAAAKLSVSSGSYVLEDGKTYSTTEGYLALNLDIKNTSGKTISNIYENDFVLYDSKNNQIKAENVYAGDNSQFKTLESTNLSPDKNLTGYVVFQVDKGAKYELHFNPSPYDKSSKDIVLKIDSSNYKDPAKDLQDYAGNYVDAVFLGKKGVTSKLTNDFTKAQATFEASFVKGFKNATDTYYTPSDAEAQSVFTAYETANANKAKVEYSIYTMFPDYAVVYVKPEIIDFDSVDTKSIIDSWVSANQGKYDDYSKAESDAVKNLIQQFPAAFNNTAVGSPQYMSGEGYKLILKKDTSGKWSVNDSDSDSNYDFQSLQKAFTGNVDSWYLSLYY